MKIRNTAAIVAAIAMVATVQTSQATLATSDTLADLIAHNGSIGIGDKVFSGFSALGTFDISVAPTLTVTASIGAGGVYYLEFGGAILVNNLLGTTPDLGDLLLGYTVTATGKIWMIDQAYTPNGLPGSGQILIGETVQNPGGVTVGQSELSLNPTDLSDPLPEAGDNLIFNPEHQLKVVKDILIVAKAGEVVGLSHVYQSFHQVAVPEPTTVIAGALLLLPFGVSTLRIMRKNRLP